MTTLRVRPASKYIYSIHAGCCGAVTVACSLGLRGLRYGSWLPQCGTICPWARHFTCMCTLDPRVNEYLVGRSLLACLNRYQHKKNWQQGCISVCPPGRTLSWCWKEQLGPIITTATHHNPWEDYILYVTQHSTGYCG